MMHFAGSLKRAVLDMPNPLFHSKYAGFGANRFIKLIWKSGCWIIQWMMAALRQHQRCIDPVLILAMIMKESYFMNMPFPFPGGGHFAQTDLMPDALLPELPERRPPPDGGLRRKKRREYCQIRRDRRGFLLAQSRNGASILTKCWRLSPIDRYARDARIYKDYIERLDEFDRRRSEARPVS